MAVPDGLMLFIYHRAVAFGLLILPEVFGDSDGVRTWKRNRWVECRRGVYFAGDGSL